MCGNGLLSAPAPLCDVRASCSPDRAQIPSLRSLPHQLSLPSGLVVTSVCLPRVSSWRVAADAFPSSSCTCSRRYVGSGCSDARAEKRPFACRRHLRRTVAFHDGSSLCNNAAKTRNCQVRSLWSWRNCLWPPMPPISHTTLSHTALSHIAFSHNLSSTPPSPRYSRTQLSHTQLTPTALSHTTLSYAPLSHNLSSTRLTHAHTHTCSEISSRITDVECIERAQTIQ